MAAAMLATDGEKTRVLNAGESLGCPPLLVSAIAWGCGPWGRGTPGSACGLSTSQGICLTPTRMATIQIPPKQN